MSKTLEHCNYLTRWKASRTSIHPSCTHLLGDKTQLRQRDTGRARRPPTITSTICLASQARRDGSSFRYRT